MGGRDFLGSPTRAHTQAEWTERSGMCKRCTAHAREQLSATETQLELCAFLLLNLNSPAIPTRAAFACAWSLPSYF